MSFLYILDTSPEFPVKNVAIDYSVNGHWKRDVVDLTFKRASTEEIESLRTQKPIDVVRSQLVGWARVKDDQGNPVEFNEDTKAGFLLVLPAVAAAARAFWDNQLKGNEKN